MDKFHHYSSVNGKEQRFLRLSNMITFRFLNDNFYIGNLRGNKDIYQVKFHAMVHLLNWKKVH